MKEWLLELGKAIAWLFLFLLTYSLFLGGATFIVHGWYALNRHLLLGLPNMGIAPDDGPQVVDVGKKMLLGGVGLLVASVVLGRFCLGIMKEAVEENKRDRLS